MNLNEIATLWEDANKGLEEQLKINRTLFKEVSVNKLRSQLREIKWTQYFEIIFNFLFLIFLIGFTIDHLLLFKYSIPSATLLGLMFYGFGMNANFLRLYYRIDVRSSVLQTQRIVEKLKYYQVLKTNLLYVIIPLFSVPFLIVLAKALFDFDVYVLGNWLIYYTAGSFIIAMIVVFFLKRFPDKNLEKVQSFLREIREFENDESSDKRGHYRSF